MTKIPYIESLFSWIEKKSEKWYYVYLLTIVTILVTSNLNSVYEYKYQSYNKWNILLLKSLDLTNNLSGLNPQSHEAKTVFRLFTPILIRLFHLGYVKLHIFQYLIGLLIIIFSYKFTMKILNDSVSASLISIGLICTYFGSNSFIDMSSFWLDGFSFFFIIMSMYVSSPFFIFFFSSCAAWNDERAFMALTIVFIFHQMFHFESSNKIKIKDLVIINRRSFAVFFAMICYLALRIFLQFEYSMHTSFSDGLVNFNVFVRNIPVLPIAILSFLEGFWFLLIIFILITLHKKDYLFLAFISFIVLLFSISSGFVLDVTRTGSYLMPVIFILLNYLKNKLDRSTIRKALLIVLFICIVIPAYLVMSIGNRDIYWYGLIQKIYTILYK